MKGNYDIIDAQEDPYILLALIRDWVRSVDGGLIPAEHVKNLQELVECEDDEAVYQAVLQLPLVLRSTILYLVRFIWQMTLFPKSVRRNPDSSLFFYSSIYPTTMVIDSVGSSTQFCSIINALLRSVAVHERESFLPADPTAANIEQYKVLLFSHIPPLLSRRAPYSYTLSNLHTLEQTAERMFQYGLLPETNNFGCSTHRLPKVSEKPLSLFDTTTEYFIKTPETRVYSTGHLWLSPFLDSIHVALEGDWRCVIPLQDIQVGFSR